MTLTRNQKGDAINLMSKIKCRFKLYIYSYFCERWNENGFRPEILYRGTFCTHLPWKGDDFVEDHYSKLKYIYVIKLCHITHNRNAEDIEQAEDYVFKPKSKNGKFLTTSDGSPLGETYILSGQPYCDGEVQYKYISPISRETVLPGYYIWWSIDLSDVYFYNIQYSKGEYPSRPFARPEASMYGNNKFSCDISELIECYRNAYRVRSPDDAPIDVQFRCGGTLRYRYEICYVIIVCDGQQASLPEDTYPVLHRDVAEYRDGRVFCTAKFENIVGYCRERYSWDTYAISPTSITFSSVQRIQ